LNVVPSFPCFERVIHYYVAHGVSDMGYDECVVVFYEHCEIALFIGKGGHARAYVVDAGVFHRCSLLAVGDIPLEHPAVLGWEKYHVEQEPYYDDEFSHTILTPIHYNYCIA
jgi:hypothetical protein